MKKIMIIAMIFFLVSCQAVENKDIENQIIKETTHYYKLAEVNDEIMPEEIVFSKCKEYKDGLVVEEYTLSPIGEKHNVTIYEYDGQLVKSIVRQDGILKYETIYSYKGKNKTSILSYHNNELKGKTTYSYKGEDTIIKYYDGEDELISETRTTTNGNYQYVEYTLYPDETGTLEIELDSNDNPIKTKSIIGDIVSVSEVTYDEYGNKTYVINPEMEIRYDYQYDEKGEYIEMKTYHNDVLVRYQTREVEYEE